MRNKIKTMSMLCLSIFLACACNETGTKKVSMQNDNDALYDSISNDLQKSNLHLDSLNVIFVQELQGSNGSFGYGPSAHKIHSQMDSCTIANQKIKLKLDSVFALTSKEFKIKHYNNALNQLDIQTEENKNNLIRLQKSLQEEVKGGGYGIQAKKIKSEILLLEEKNKLSKVAKDSINKILIKIK